MFIRKILAVTVLLACTSEAAAAGNTGGIRGYVRDAVTGKALAGVAVSIDGPAQSIRVVTDKNGFYSLTSLAVELVTIVAGADSCIARAPIYADETYDAGTLWIERRDGAQTCRNGQYLPNPGKTAGVYDIF